MGRKKRDTIEFRFYEIPQGQSCLALLGEKWVMKYGEADKYLHFHNLFEVGYCRNGAGELILDEKTCLYDRGMLSVIPANYPHATFSPEVNYWEYIFFDAESVVKEIFPDNPTKQREALDIVNKRADLLNGEDHPEMVEIITRIMEEMRKQDSYYVETTRNLLRAFVLLLIRLQKTMDADKGTFIDTKDRAALMTIRPALEYIDSNYAEVIKVSKLAECCSMSETNFRRIFDGAINMSPMDYVNLVRIQKSCDIMNKTDHSMEIVASECGFTTFSTFNRNFQKYLGTSPYQWKKNKENYVNKLLDYNINALKGW
ncbi:MAG: AraC family transcriptional regulator [Butyrivibrio sp.]|nr:AraC family transcriptional regulator [Butyrivibrio sp.]